MRRAIALVSLTLLTLSGACSSKVEPPATGGSGGNGGSGGSGGTVPTCDGVTCAVPEGEACAMGHCTCEGKTCPPRMKCNDQHLCESVLTCASTCGEGETCLPLPTSGVACQCNPGDDRCPAPLRCGKGNRCLDPCKGACNDGESCEEKSGAFICLCDPSAPTCDSGSHCDSVTRRCVVNCKPDCATGEDCVQNPSGSYACVCNPQNDTCPEITHCDPTSLRCVVNCPGGCFKGETCTKTGDAAYACQCDIATKSCGGRATCNPTTLHCEARCVPDCVAGETCVDGTAGKVCRCDPNAGSCTGGLTCDATALRCLQPDIDTVVQAYAHAFCLRGFECMPYMGITRYSGDDVADCTRQSAAHWRRSLRAPGAYTDLTWLQTCTAAVNAASCQQIADGYGGTLAAQAIPACDGPRPPGRVSNAGTCAYSAQCQSSFCSSLEGQCGTCQPMKSHVGDTCNATTDVCDPTLGLVCGSAGTCFHPAGRGDPCNDDPDCQSFLLCRAHKCVDYTTKKGAACTPSVNDCSFRLGEALSCTSSGLCEPATVNTTGQPCGWDTLGDGHPLVCDKGSVCDGSIDGWNGNCVAGHAGAVGDACAFPPCTGNCTWAGAPIDGPSCEYESQCLAGTCQVSDPEACF